MMPTAIRNTGVPSEVAAHPLVGAGAQGVGITPETALANYRQLPPGQRAILIDSMTPALAGVLAQIMGPEFLPLLQQAAIASPDMVAQSPMPGGGAPMPPGGGGPIPGPVGGPPAGVAPRAPGGPPAVPMHGPPQRRPQQPGGIAALTA